MMSLPILLAAISGQALVNALIWLVVVGLVFWLLFWLIGYLNVPEPFNKVIRIILVVIAVIFLINVLLGLAGRPIFDW